jgi:hypothetical protein
MPRGVRWGLPSNREPWNFKPMSLTTRVLELDASLWDTNPECIDQLRSGIWVAVVLKQLYSFAEMKKVVERLDHEYAENQNSKAWATMQFPESFRGWFLGENLNLLEGDLFDYFEREPVFSANMKRLFIDIPGGENRIFHCLSKIDRGRRYIAAPGPDVDYRYQFTTLRGHAEGGYIPIHCDNEQSWRPSYEHLLTQIHPNLFSFVLMIGKPIGGGNLRIYNQRIKPEQRQTIEQARYSKTDDLFMNDYVEINLDPGDLVLADSGMHPHEVTKVVGSKIRWAMCSFMAQSKAGQAVYCWG